MKTIIIALGLITQLAVAQDYRRETRKLFTSQGYEHYAFNHEEWDLIKVDNTNNNIINISYMVISDNKYIIEKNVINCKDRTTMATDQYESINGSQEKHYTIAGVFEKATLGSIQQYWIKQLCKPNRKGK